MAGERTFDGNSKSLTIGIKLIIESERLILRQWGESDKLGFAKMNADPEVMKFFPKQLTQTESDLMVDNITRRIDARGWGLFAVEMKKINKFIGFIGLAEPKFKAHFTPCVEIGWRLDKSYWRMGLATEGALEVLNFAFNKIGLNEIVSFTAKKNIPSIAVMKKIGMVNNPFDDFKHPNISSQNSDLIPHVLFKINKANFKRR